MSKLCFRLCNQAGVQACIERDGVWIKIGKNTKRFDLKTNLEEKWFKNPKAYLSISGSFMYLISDGELNLLTLTCDKNNMVYADELEKGTKFIDANFSYEETLLYALTDSNKIYVFSLLPPKKIQELFFDWDHIATSFKTLFFSPDDGFDSTIAFSIESDSGAKVTQDFCIPKEHQYLRPNQRLVLEPIEERKSLFPSFDELLHEQDSHIVSSNDEDDETESPTTIEEAVKALQKKGEKLRKYENKIKKRTKKLEAKIDFINSKYESIHKKCQKSKKRFENLFSRVERLIESADGGIGLVQISKQQKINQDWLQSFDQFISHDRYSEIGDDVIFHYRSLQKYLDVLQYNINLLNKTLEQEKNQ